MEAVPNLTKFNVNLNYNITNLSSSYRRTLGQSYGNIN